MVNRESYIQQLYPFIDKPFVKILTGIRRSGKSTVLTLLKNELFSRNIAQEQIIYINFESFESVALQTASGLYQFVKQKIQKDKQNYLFLDEIQEVEGWEKAINSFLVDFQVDVYLTGSNSHLLSSELATYLTGRYIEIPVYTLSFAESIQFHNHYLPDKQRDQQVTFQNYLDLGGFPVIHTSDYTQETASKIVFDIYSSVILRDTIQRNKIRDVELLERVVKYAFDNIGNTFSGKNVADYFKNQQRKVDVNTVYNYLHALESAFILYRASRYDIKGKEILKTQEKFYVSDLSLLYALAGFKNRMISGILENMVFLELKRRGYKVYIGKLGDKEIDFIAEKKDEKIYVQVAYKLENEQTVNREFNSLLAIKDQYPKYVVTMDTFWKENVEGIKHVYLVDFLLMQTY